MTNQSQISITIAATSDNGGSPITSYSLEWDAGTAGVSYTSLIGESSDNLDLIYNSTGVTAGGSYMFRVRAKNIYGWSSYSSTLTAIAAEVPDQPSSPTVTNTGTSVKIAWTDPFNGGSAITSYGVQLLHADGTTYSSDLTNCNAASDGTIIANKYCVIPMATLTAGPFSLTQGTIVVARVLATNAIGSSSYSTPNSLGADIRVAPHAPSVAPSRGDGTDVDRIEVVISQLTSTATGGSSITSYNIDYNENGGPWIELQGLSSNSLALTATKTGLNSATNYEVRYRAKNIFGWGPYSATTVIKTIKEPDQVGTAVTSLSGTNVIVDWTAPAINGASISAYKVLFKAVDGNFYEDASNCDGS